MEPAEMPARHRQPRLGREGARTADVRADHQQDGAGRDIGQEKIGIHPQGTQAEGNAENHPDQNLQDEENGYHQPASPKTRKVKGEEAEDVVTARALSAVAGHYL